MRLLCLAFGFVLCGCHAPRPPALFRWTPTVATQPVGNDPDDPAIWIHPDDRSQSLIIATNKVSAPEGSLVVFDLQGKILQTIGDLDRPNNVDLRQDVQWGDVRIDLVVTTERRRGRLAFFAVDKTKRKLRPLGYFPVFAKQTGEAAAPMGIALHVRAADGKLFAIVGRKTGPNEGYLWQYSIEPGPKLVFERQFGRFSGTGEIEAIVCDDRNGYVYYADEGAGIRKYWADPNHASASRELALFGKTGYQGDREGLAIYATGERTGFLVSTDQIEGGSRYLLYRREGQGGYPHNHDQLFAVIEGGADETDGIEIASMGLGPKFPYGMLVTMNSKPKNFLLFAWPQTPPGYVDSPEFLSTK